LTATVPSLSPHPLYGHYALADGSRVYPSGRERGRYFAWVFEYTTVYSGGRRVAEGSVLMDRAGVRYFRTVECACRAIREAKEAARGD
jgi:hypothetical protein